MIQYDVWDGSKSDLQKHNNLMNCVFKNRNRSIDYFYWKHLENPLGKSIITYARYNNIIIGARALQPTLYRGKRFMQPCDTVTHHDYQRKGIFLALTKLALDQIDEGVGVVNFPNKSSLPAYLKAGWKYHKFHKPSINLNFINIFFACKKINVLEANLKLSNMDDKLWAEYCKWRFIRNPVKIYKYFVIKNNLVIVNERRMSYCIKLSSYQDNDSGESVIPFLCYSYNLKQHFNPFEKLIHKATRRGTNLVSLTDDVWVVNGQENIELSGLMDTF